MEHLITESFIACLTGTEPKIKKASFDTQKTYPMGILEHWDAIEAMAASNPDLDITAVIEKWMAENPGLPKKKKPTKAATKYWDAFNELAPIDGSAFDYLKDPSAFSPDELVKLEDALVATYGDRAHFDAETGGSFMNLTPHIRIAVGKIYIARGKLVELAALTVATEKHLQKQDPLWDKYEIKGMWAEINRYHKALGREGKHYYDEALNTVIDAEIRSRNNRRKDQIAGKAAREAAAKARDGRFDQAAHSLRAAATAVQSLSASEFTEDAQSLLDQSLRRIGSGDLTARDLKELVYESRHRIRSSSHDLYTGSRKKQKSGASGKGQRRQTEQ